MQADKKQSRIRRSRRARAKIKRHGDTRLTVFRTNQHMYAQVISVDGLVIASASTLDKELRQKGATSNVEAAKAVGALLAKRAVEKGVKQIAFDRSGFKYHGRVKALADAAREAGLEF